MHGIGANTIQTGRKPQIHNLERRDDDIVLRQVKFEPIFLSLINATKVQ